MLKYIASFSFVIGVISSMILGALIAVFSNNISGIDLIKIWATVISALAVILAIWVHIKNSLWRIEDKENANSEFNYKEGVKLLDEMEQSFNKEKLTRYDLDAITLSIYLLPKIKEKLKNQVHIELLEEKIAVTKSKFENKISQSGAEYLYGFELDIKELRGTDKFMGLHHEILDSLHQKNEKTNGKIFDCDMLGFPIEFISGLNQKHIVAISSYLYNIDEDMIKEKLDGHKYNTSKWIRRKLPYLTAAYFFSKETCKNKIFNNDITTHSTTDAVTARDS